MKEGPGHDNLINELERLLAEAREFQFHDFKNTKYAQPKVALVYRFQALADMTKSGSFDN